MTRLLSAILIAGLAISAWAGITIDPSRTLYTGRAMGMGGATLGFANDGEGIFTNPSGLSRIIYPQMVGVSRKIFLDETTYQVVGWATPTDYGTFGMGYIGTGIGGSYPTLREPGTNRIVINPSLEAMGYDNSVLMFTYARTLPWYGIALGGNLKFFNQSIGGGGVGDRASAMNLDLSATYSPLSYLTLGANLQNILGGSVSWTGTGNTDTIGGYWKLGGALKLFGANKEEALLVNDKINNMSVGLDIDLPQNVLGGAGLYHLGVEYLPLDFVALRAGLNQESGGTGMTFGVGFKNTAFRFDYAFAPRPGIAADNPHYFSLSYVGDMVITKDRKLKNKVSGVSFIRPQDRDITPDPMIKIVCQAQAKRIMNEKTTWTVPIISSTSEVKEVYEFENLADVYIDGRPIDKVGTIETTRDLTMGRNVISAAGTVKPESFLVSGEVRVLRFKPMGDMDMKHWAIRPVVLCQTLDLIKGYPDETFKPEKGITRAELTALLVRTLNLSLDEQVQAENEAIFTDVKPEAWYTQFVNLGAKLGLVTGYPDGTFKPNRVLNRAEGVTIISRFAKLEEKAGVPFPDLTAEFWANKHIAAAKAAGLLKYLEGKNFNAKSDFPRAEAAEVLYQSPPIQKKVDEFWRTGIVTSAGSGVPTPATVPIPTIVPTSEAPAAAPTSEAR